MSGRVRRFLRLVQGAEAHARGLRSHRRYVCGKCGASGVRLFRRYNVFADKTPLLCGPCSCVVEGREETQKRMEGNNIGGMIAAVPATHKRIDAGKPFAPVFCGYSAHEMDAYRWWLALPWRKVRP